MDKLCQSTANKNTIGYVVPRGYEPYSTFRKNEEISGPMAPSAILQRGTPSVILTGAAYKALIETKRKMYEILTGESFDEILKQKQPWMIHTNDNKSAMESTSNLPDMSDKDIELLESVFDLYSGKDGYESSKYYFKGDMILPLPENANYQKIIDKFGLLESNVEFDDETGIIRAMEDIAPGTTLSL